MSFLPKFNNSFYPYLNGNPSEKKKQVYANIFQRADAFRLIFSLLELKNKKSYNIVETGVIRNLGNWNDGQSSFLFQEFLKSNSGTLRSVDINIDACNVAKSILDDNISKVVCSDSVSFLSTVNPAEVDLFFLDSYDVDWNNCQPSAEHHLNEFKSIESKLVSGTIIAIDDNIMLHSKRSGKGRNIFNYLESKNILPIYDKYMIIYIWR
jgi:hypothetical protein